MSEKPTEGSYEVVTLDAKKARTLVLTGKQIHEMYGPQTGGHGQRIWPTEDSLFLVLIDDRLGRVTVFPGEQRDVHALGRRFAEMARAV